MKKKNYFAHILQTLQIMWLENPASMSTDSILFPTEDISTKVVWPRSEPYHMAWLSQWSYNGLPSSSACECAGHMQASVTVKLQHNVLQIGVISPTQVIIHIHSFNFNVRWIDIITAENPVCRSSYSDNSPYKGGNPTLPYGNLPLIREETIYFFLPILAQTYGFPHHSQSPKLTSQQLELITTFGVELGTSVYLHLEIFHLPSG